MVSSAYDETIRIWNLKKAREIGFRVEPEANDRCLSISSDGQTVVYGAFDALKVWQWKTNEEMHLEGHTDRIITVTISGNGQTVVSGSYDQTIKVWNLALSR